MLYCLDDWRTQECLDCHEYSMLSRLLEANESLGDRLLKQAPITELCLLLEQCGFVELTILITCIDGSQPKRLWLMRVVVVDSKDRQTRRQHRQWEGS